ncbi:Putative Integrase [Bradyrhizobium vignae]|uniref:Integrase n=2 Tax=Bradyrhizobium vignae TaxID=1549949 RepID=A0A2U3PVH8_9BRAD|nr:Putative Integrase [Bradyrhizobium vignae]
MLKLGELVMILDLHRQGLSVSAIARQLGVDRKTVRAYIAKGLEPPVYKKRAVRPGIVDHFEAYLRERLAAYPALTAVRLWRELKERGFVGGYSIVRDRVRELRPAQPAAFQVRFETPAGEQAQVDFARFEVQFVDEPGVKRIVWLFSMVLGYSRLIWARFVVHQDLQTVLRCHIAALEAIGGAPREILYDRMKTAVLGQDAEGLVVYNRALVDLARHYGFQPRACRPYRPKTKGKVERPFRYIREDFFLGGVFRNLDDLNGQLRHWLDTVANPRVHATTHRVVNEAFAEEKAALQALPSAPYRAVLHLERRASHEGMVSVGGNPTACLIRGGGGSSTSTSSPTKSASSRAACWWQVMPRSKVGARSGSIRHIASSPASADAVQAVQNPSPSRAPVTTPFVARLTSTRPSVAAWQPRRSYDECFLRHRARQDQPGQSEDAARPGNPRCHPARPRTRRN